MKAANIANPLLIYKSSKSATFQQEKKGNYLPNTTKWTRKLSKAAAFQGHAG
jgi:hypothetical protein